MAILPPYVRLSSCVTAQRRCIGQESPPQCSHQIHTHRLEPVEGHGLRGAQAAQDPRRAG
jgi:hypothetical protein